MIKRITDYSPYEASFTSSEGLLYSDDSSMKRFQGTDKLAHSPLSLTDKVPVSSAEWIGVSECVRLPRSGHRRVSQGRQPTYSQPAEFSALPQSCRFILVP